MGGNNVFILILFGIVAIAAVVFFIQKNKKDKKLLNPDAPGSVEETHMDTKRNAEKI